MRPSSGHWDTVFSTTKDTELGWYEKDVSKTLKLLAKIPGWKRSTVFIAGAGTSLLIEELLSREMALVLNDISSKALARVKRRLKGKPGTVHCLCHDISQPIKDVIPDIGIWVDRAVLHFLTDKADILGYFKNVRALLKPGGYALFAEFSKTGAEKCAGLPVHRYSAEELSKRLGPSFRLVSQFDHVYINPYGEPKPYIYALFKKLGRQK